MTTELNVLHGKLKYLKEYVVKLGTKRNTELAYKKFQEAESIYQQSLKICFELEKQKLTISTSDKIVNNLVFEEIESFYRDIESLVTFRPKSNTERSKIAMASFDIKTAIALLPVMTGQDAIKLYSSMISEVSKPTLIEFVLKTRLSASGKLRLKSSYASTDDLIADMKKFLIQKKSAVALHTQLLRTNQGNKTIESFGTELEELFVNLTLAQADGNDDNFQILRPINEKIAIKRFADGLSDTRLSTIITSRQFDSLPEAIRTAIDEQLQSQQTYDVMTGYPGHDQEVSSVSPAQLQRCPGLSRPNPRYKTGSEIKSHRSQDYIEIYRRGPPKAEDLQTAKELKNRKASTEEESPAASEDTATTTATETTVSERTASRAATDTSATSRSTAVPSSETSTSAVPSSASVREMTATAAASQMSAPTTVALALPADATQLGPPAAVEASAIEQGRSQAREASAIQKRRRTVKPQEVPLPPSKKGEGSTHSRSKAHRIAKAKEELLRLQVELAAARITAMEAEETEDEIEDDGASIHSGAETSERVGNWLESQPPRPALAITSEPHYPIEPVVNSTGQQKHQNPLQSPAGVQPGLTELAEAITLAVKAARRPKFIELPIFGGSHQEWLPFRAAYYETESMFTTIENTNRLRRNLKGRAKEAVEGLLITSAHPTEVMKTLESRFGRPESIAMMEIEALRGLPRLTESPRDICIFSTKVSNVVATLKTLSCVNYMFNPEVSKTVVDKLTPTLRYRYYDFAVLQPKEDPELMKMEKFLKREAELCGPYALPEQVAPHTSHAPATQQRRPQKIHNVTEKQYTPKCAICEGEHGESDCEQFKNADANGRWDIAKSKRLCFRCLRYRNRTHNCRVKACGVNSCKYFHHKMLHYTKAPEKKEGVEITEIINSAWTIQKKQSYLKIIPVQVEGPKGALNTFALMDDGSTVTLIDNSIAELIGATGPIDPLKIETINDMKTSESASRRVNIKLRGLNNHEERIQARTVKNLQVSSQRVSRELVDGCTHLADIRDYLVYADIKPRVLIGQDNWHLLLTTEVRRGNSNQPVASLTPLGWVLHGSQSRAAGRSIDFVSHVTEGTEDDLDSLVKQYFEMDALCIQPKKPKTDPEEQALRILEKTTTKQEDGRYETGLLWRKEDVTFPDNYNNSLKRLHNIEKKIDRDPKLKQKYTEQMEALISKGYAELAPKQKTAGKTWYLPHFAVINPMKPEKLRVVHDAAAKTKGVALNDMLLKGPDLLQSLPGVIMRFRQHAVAVTADIKEMFMQVKLRAEDRDALRYLWRGERRDSQPPEEYRMTSLIFGASSSPSTAIYIKNLNAEQHKEAHPEAAAAIIQKHYVDDYLDSFRNLEEAVRITKSVREVHSKASFELKQWKSNSPQLLEALGEVEPTEDMELYKPEEKTERVLGVIWKLNTDELTFNLNLARVAPTLISGKTPTKREALRVVMSLFDPLGLASPVTIRAKQLLQEVWRRGTSWDDEIDEDLAEQWQDWMNHLKNLSSVAIPRRYLQYNDATSIQLHVFTDASEAAYSAVVFWRTVTPEGEVSLSLIMAKAKVAPLKLTSIPRLELQAAVMGTRLAETVIEEHERKPDCKVFWTDSKTVLTWIRTGARSYKPYVAHRLAAIEESSKVNEWRWVPTKLNVADDATRDVPTSFDEKHRWYKGPDFLYEAEDQWPVEVSTEKEEPSGEERIHHVIDRSKPKLSQALPEVSRFSNWDRLRYTTARVLQFIELCRATKQSVNYRRTRKNTEKDPNWKKTNKPATKQKQTVKTTASSSRKFLPVTAEHLRRAEELLMRSSQEDSFGEEIEVLNNSKTLNKESRLHQLSVEYVNNTIRLRSRIQATEGITEHLKSPMVLDGDHSTIRLWVNAVHQQLHHAGVETTVNECRQQYWVLRLTPVTRMVIRRCLFCRMKTQKPPYPRTGDLPGCRLAHHRRPFTFTGVDYFGPLSVTVGRTRQKRWVAIFTCLTMRAIHLEIAGSLSADSAVMALRRMMAKRGTPTEVWSDNGSNLKAADKELRQALDEATAEEAAKKTISWRYIPPGAPFMGGAWERLVRSVKTALTATLHERHPTEEVLSTLLAEVEYTVNSRPLTHVSVSPDDPEALTPNHFLLGGPGRVPLPGTFDEEDAVSRSTWRASQRLADIFWTRWVKEYLPELQNRREPHGRGPAIQSNDLVQVVDANLPRNVWIRGRVIATYPGPDNVVRAVDIRTKGAVLRRPVRKLVVLPVSTDDAPAPTDNAT
ncbi:uncharacterized protein [Maniola hyperantus]|uniref:uncharacterized protein n=1 Tax=Aphantopus hyperantus TaxID=2795564 RepID=UPI003747E979